MNRFFTSAILFIAIVALPLSCYSKTINVFVGLEETLESKYTEEFSEADSLFIHGYFHTADIDFIRKNLSSYTSGHSVSNKHVFRVGKLEYLDLSDAKYAEIAGGSMREWSLPPNFGNYLAISELRLSKLDIDRDSFSYNPFLKSLKLSPGTEIGAYCFRHCDALKEVFIPKGCTLSIGCFRGTGLIKFDVSPEHTDYTSIDGMLLSKDGKILYEIPRGLSRVKIPDIVEEVSYMGLEQNPQIEVIQFGANFKDIHKSAFNQCSRLDRLIITSNDAPIMNISGYGDVFSNCDHFKRVGTIYVPQGTKIQYEGSASWGVAPNIIEYAPNELDELFSKEIEDDKFGLDYDFRLDDIYYKVTSIEDNTVGVVNGYKPYIGSFDIPNEITYKNRKLRVTSIISMNNGDVTSLILPNSVTSIGGLSGNSFETIEIPKNLVELKSGVFSHCCKLKGIDIPESVQDIPASAFRGCYNLEYVNWRPSQSSADIGPYAFHDCFSLKTFTFTSNMWATGTISTSGLGYVSAFYYCTSLDSVSFEENSRIYFGYYYEGTESDNDCGEFYGSNIKKVYLGSLYSNHFFSPGPHFSNLEEVTIGDNIQKIEKERNYSTYPPLYGLKKLTLGAKLSKIEPFSSEKIWVRNPNPPIVNGELSNEVYLNSELFVLKGSIEAYRNAPIWKNFWNISEYDISSSVIEIDSGIVKHPIGIYDINGTLHDEPIKGLNIIRYSDGTTEKKFY